MSKSHRNAKISHGQLKFQKKAADHTKWVSETQLNLDKYNASKWLFKIVALCEAHDIEIFIVEMPGFKKTQNANPIGPYALGTKKNGAPLYNFNSQGFCTLFNDAEDWIGNNHLNEKGGKKFTKYLHRMLTQ